MITELTIIFLLLINLVLIYFLNKKKIKTYFSNYTIKKVDISEINDLFELVEISKNLKGPKKEAIIKSFSVTPKNQIVGMTSDLEAWIISTLSKKSMNIFEFGTCSGKTTFMMALNAPDEAKITTITIDPKEIDNLLKNDRDNSVSFRNIINESIYNKFLFTGNEVDKKIKVIFQNSLEFDHTNYKKKIDLIFIDGGHTYSVVKNDSEKSFDMISNDGIILWHDYVPGKRSAKDVVKYLNEISKTKKLYNIMGTSLVYFKNG